MPREKILKPQCAMLMPLESPEQCAETKQRIDSGENPLQLKLDLVTRIVNRFNGAGNG